MSLPHGPWVATDLAPDCEFLKSSTWQHVKFSPPGPLGHSPLGVLGHLAPWPGPPT